MAKEIIIVLELARLLTENSFTKKNGLISSCVWCFGSARSSAWLEIGCTDWPLIIIKLYLLRVLYWRLFPVVSTRPFFSLRWLSPSSGSALSSAHPATRLTSAAPAGAAVVNVGLSLWTVLSSKNVRRPQERLRNARPAFEFLERFVGSTDGTTKDKNRARTRLPGPLCFLPSKQKK